jgi:L-iditol 2-dehydrogenase
VDLAVEVVGVADAIHTAISNTRKGGSVTLVGNVSATAEIPLQQIVTKQIRLQGSCAICGEYPAVLEMMARKKINTEAILSAEAPLSEGAAWFQRLYNKEPGLIKVVLKPEG